MGKEIRAFNSVTIPHRSEDPSTDDGGPLFFIRSADRGAAQCRFVDLGLEALRHSRRGTIIGRITRPGMAHQERPKGRRPCPYFDFFGTRFFG
jgi:hypothetical protein